jgi:AraC-like DNA-binding protein
LIFEDVSPSREEGNRSISNAVNDLCTAGSLDQQLDHAAEELITGDSDDAPLSEEAVVDRLGVSRLYSSHRTSTDTGVNPKKFGGTNQRE